MGFIDYQGTKENRYTDVLEFAKAQQEEEARRLEDEKVGKWVTESIGDARYVGMTITVKTMEQEVGSVKAPTLTLDPGERKIDIFDLETTRLVSIQMAPQIRLLQNADQQVVDKLRSDVINTIPLWEKCFLNIFFSMLEISLKQRGSNHIFIFLEICHRQLDNHIVIISFHQFFLLLCNLLISFLVFVK